MIELDRAPDDFCPVLRFCVCSDLHIKAPSDAQTDRLRQVMETTYAIAETHPTYQGVDAFLFAGDLTNNGTPQQFQAFWDTVQGAIRTGTKVLCSIARYHDNWEFGKGGKKTGLTHYQSITGLTPDTHLVIKGFHFIAVSTCPKWDRYYTRKQHRWLRRALQTAQADTPNAPVFVMQHEHVRNTVYGSSSFDGWGLTYFSSILSKYQNVVHFSGHSHYPLNDPRSVWQGDFTAVGTGALSYAEFTVKNQRKVHPPMHRTIAQGWIVEVDRKNTVVLSGYDFLSGKRLCTYLLRYPANKDAFPLTPQKQKARSSPPQFPAGAELTVKRTGEEIEITFPAAQSTDGFPVFLYHAELRDADGRVLEQDDVLGEFWFVHDKPFYSMTLPAHAGECTVIVQAQNAYEMASPSLTIKLSS